MPSLLTSENIIGVQLKEGAAPSTPASGFARLYADTNGRPRIKNDAGTDTALAATQCSTVTRDTQQTTTSTSYTDITSMSITLTTTGGTLLIWYNDCMQHGSAGANVYVQLLVDGSAVQEAVFTSPGGGYGQIVSLHVPSLALSAGSHTIKAQMKCDTGTIYSNTQNSAAGRARLTVAEI